MVENDAPVSVQDQQGPASDTSKLLAALGYAVWPVALIAVLIEPYKAEPYVKFHAVQALGFSLGMVVLSAVASMVPFFGSSLAALAWLVIAIVWAVKAYNGELAQMPLVYDLVKNYIK